MGSRNERDESSHDAPPDECRSQQRDLGGDAESVPLPHAIQCDSPDAAKTDAGSKSTRTSPDVVLSVTRPRDGVSPRVIHVATVSGMGDTSSLPAASQLVVNYLRDVASEMEVRSRDGKLVRKIDLPPLGSASRMSGRPDEDTAYFGF